MENEERARQELVTLQQAIEHLRLGIAGGQFGDPTVTHLFQLVERALDSAAKAIEALLPTE